MKHEYVRCACCEKPIRVPSSSVSLALRGASTVTSWPCRCYACIRAKWKHIEGLGYFCVACWPKCEAAAQAHHKAVEFERMTNGIRAAIAQAAEAGFVSCDVKYDEKTKRINGTVTFLAPPPQLHIIAVQTV